MPLQLPLHGDGFELRAIERADADELADIEFDPSVKRYLALPKKPKELWLKEFDPRAVSALAVVSTDGTFAGSASLDRAKRRGDAELRVVIGKAHWGQGLGTKVATLLVKVAFEQLSAKAVVAHVHPENQASLRLLRSLRFRRRGTLSGQVADWQQGHYIYRLTRGAYFT